MGNRLHLVWVEWASDSTEKSDSYSSSCNRSNSKSGNSNDNDVHNLNLSAEVKRTSPINILQDHESDQTTLGIRLYVAIQIVNTGVVSGEGGSGGRGRRAGGGRGEGGPSDFGIFGRVPEPQNQYCLSLETPGLSTNFKKTHQNHFLKMLFQEI